MFLFCQTLKQVKQFQQNNLFVIKFDTLEKQISIANIFLVQKAANYAVNLKGTDQQLRTFLWYCSAIFN